MARARLDELGAILDGLRGMPELVEVSPGVFHVDRRAFLHFHESDTARSADVRDGTDWGERIGLPLGPVSKTTSARFLQEVERRLAATLTA
ncbi:MAG TPA: hypothetical protein VEP49_17880 [Acidimicrobiia bacterium]|nr:hypothetical protein [Acidimicrobiia bacterium]